MKSSSRSNMHRDIYLVLVLPLLQLGLLKVDAFHCHPTAAFITAGTHLHSKLSLKMVEWGGAGGSAAAPAIAERPTEQSDDNHTTNNLYLEDGRTTTFSIDSAKQSLLENVPYITTTNRRNEDSLNNDDDDAYYNYNNYNDICRLVESNINYLESIYSPVQTIDFLNLVLMGEWKLVFSTNLLLPPPHLRRSTLPPTTMMDGDEGQHSRRLRLVNIVQKIEALGYNGSLTNVAQWNYDDNTNGEAEENMPSSSKGSSSNGSFSIPCTYTINQGSRMIIQVSDDRQLRPAKIDSKVIIPDNVQELVAYLRRIMPREIFDPTDHAMDTTYMDADLRIVRYTGPIFEGVRNIFVRIPHHDR